jgi:hypothetical protein
VYENPSILEQNATVCFTITYESGTISKTKRKCRLVVKAGMMYPPWRAVE